MAWPATRLASLLGVRYPLIQAPMGRVATPELVAAVSEAGALGALPGAGLDADALRDRIRAVRSLTSAPFAVNLFAPLPEPELDLDAVAAVGELIEPWRKRLGAEPPPPPDPTSIPSFDEQFAVVLDERPAAFTFTFGIPPAEALAAAREAGCVVAGTATTAAEARQLEQAGCDAVVAQGAEAGGHRATFAASFEEGMIGGLALVPAVADAVSCPVIYSGGVMDGRGIAAALALGADGVQLGTAFIGCPETGAPAAYVDSLAAGDETATTVTAAFTGRPARGVRTPFFERIEEAGVELPPYPLHAELTVPLSGPGYERGELDVVMRLAGQGSAMIRRLPAAELVATLARETESTLARLR